MSIGRHQPELVGQSVAARALDEEIGLAARSDAKVLITGESGVGKEVAAQLLHARSARASARLVTINCAGVPDTLLESEFFGHVRGSFTGAYRDRPGLLEQADRGTVFLDEIGEMSVRLQGLLLRFLETGELQRVGANRAERRVDVRVIAASNRSLEVEMDKQAFRSDLFYRLNVIRLHVPSLRARLEDVPVLARFFVDQFSTQYGKPRVALTDAALELLSSYAWPGNVRELRNVIERALVKSRGQDLTPADFPQELRRAHIATVVQQGSSAMQPTAARLFAQMVNERESFWSAVYEPFMTRDLTRQQVRDVVAMGLAEANGDYKALATLFNIAAHDFKRFIAMLRRYECQESPRVTRRPTLTIDSLGISRPGPG